MLQSHMLVRVTIDYAAVTYEPPNLSKINKGVFLVYITLNKTSEVQAIGQKSLIDLIT